MFKGEDSGTALAEEAATDELSPIVIKDERRLGFQDKPEVR